MADCENIRESFTAFIDNELQNGELNEFLLHLESCEACRAELDNLRLIVSGLNSMPDIEPPENLHEMMMSAVETVRKTERSKSLNFSNWRIYGSVAASVAAAFIIISAAMVSFSAIAESMGDKNTAPLGENSAALPQMTAFVDGIENDIYDSGEIDEYSGLAMPGSGGDKPEDSSDISNGYGYNSESSYASGTESPEEESASMAPFSMQSQAPADEPESLRDDNSYEDAEKSADTGDDIQTDDGALPMTAAFDMNLRTAVYNSAAVSARTMISVSVYIEVEDVNEALAYVDSLPVAFNYKNFNSDTYDGRSRAEAGIKVRSVYFQYLKLKQRGLGGVLSETEMRSVVYGDIIDANARLAAKETEYERVIGLLDAIEDVKQLLVVEDRLNGIISDMDSLRSSLSAWENGENNPGINITLIEKAKSIIVNEKGPSFGERIRESFTASLNALIRFMDTAMVTLSSILPAVIILSLIVVAVMLVRRGVKREK